MPLRPRFATTAALVAAIALVAAGGAASPRGARAATAPGEGDGDGEDGAAEAWPGRARLARELARVVAALRDPATLATVDPAFVPAPAHVDPRGGVAADFQRWVQYRVAFEKSLEERFGYRRLELVRACTRAPLEAPLLVADRAQALLCAEPSALLDGLLALADLPVAAAQATVGPAEVPGAPGGSEGDGPALARLEASLARAGAEARAMVAAAVHEREALLFLGRWLCRTGARRSAQSDLAHPYELGWRLQRTDPFAPNAAATASGLAVPRSVPTMSSAYHLFRALGDEPWRTEGWAPFDRGPEARHRGFEGVRLDLAAGARAARELLGLLGPSPGDEGGWAAALARELAGRAPAPASLPGVAGEVLLERATPYGGLVVGGPGPNVYGPGAPAVIVDVGGDDRYEDARDLEAALAAPLSLIVDLAGDDTYRASGVAGPGGGVFGVALLLDLAGNDRYLQGLAPGRGLGAPPEARGGSGGPWSIDLAPYFGGGPGESGEDVPALDGGFAFGASLLGIGVLLDAAGDDLYVADKWCFGAALGRGVGLALDGGGRDVRVAGALACGVGTNKGVGALVDRGGEDDLYQVWGLYRFLDVPQDGAGDAVDAGFLSFGLGSGSAWRVETRAPEPARQPTQGGGIGLLLEEGGDDLYASANCSQGSGYGGGIGVLLDLAGDDRRAALRGDGTGRAAPGELAGAHAQGDAGHLGLGLLLDVAGDDVTLGALQGGGYGWDAGAGFLVDLAGADRYGAEPGASFAAGSAGAQGLGVLLDAGGADVLGAACDRLGDASQHRPDYLVPGGPFAFAVLGGGAARTLGEAPLAPGTLRLGPVAELRPARGARPAIRAGFGALLVPGEE